MSNGTGFQGGGGGGDGGGGGGGGGGGVLTGGQESGGTDLGILNWIFSGAKTVDPWDTLGNASRILRSVCDTATIAASWRAGGDSRRAVRELAKDAFLFARTRSGQAGHQHEAAQHFARFPERLTQMEQLASGALSCAAVLAQGAPQRGAARARAIKLGAREARAAAATVPAPGVPRQLPQLPPGQREPAFVTLLRILAAQWQLYQQQQAQREQERAQRRAMRMSLSDTVGDILGSVASAVPSILPAVIGAQQASAQRQQQARLARLAFSGLGMPGGVAGAVGSTAAVLGSLLGEEPGALESGGILENLGLEGDVERTVTLWKRSTGGFRAVPQFYGVNPHSGAVNVWKSMGPCLLFRGDISAKRRVERIARLANRGGRRRSGGSPFRRRRR